MKTNNQLPSLLYRFFKWYCREDRYEEMHGDLEELYYETLENKGKRRATWQYLLNVIMCCQPYAWKRSQRINDFNRGMMKNFYFTSVRNMRKYKSYFLINISGLALGICSFIFISLFIYDETSFDRFHKNHENIFRVSNHAIINGLPNQQATTSGPLANTLLEEYAQVANSTRLINAGSMLIGRGDNRINEQKVYYADDRFFEVFSFPLISGDSKTALSNPKSMVLSENYAKKYFGDEDPVGQHISVEEDTTIYTITGVMRNIPSNSHLQFDLLGSISTNDRWNSSYWVGGEFHTYVVLYDKSDVQGMEDQMDEIIYKYMAPEIEYYTGLTISEWENAGAGNEVHYKLLPLKDIHLSSVYSGELEPGANINYIYIYAGIGLIILFVAIFNFINLATAHSSTRTKEVGVRKVIGSSRASLTLQFLFESAFISLLATSLGLILIYVFKDLFFDLVGRQIDLQILFEPIAWSIVLAFAILVGFLSGIYPALVLSSFQPGNVLKGLYKSGHKPGWFRNVLVTMQFSASIIIIIITFVIYDQIDHMLNKNLGFEKDQILMINRPDALKDKLDIFKEQLASNPDISTVSNSKTIPGKNYEIRSYRKKDDPQAFLFKFNEVNYEHLELMGIEIKSGRFFSRAFATDKSAVVINETAAKAFGYDDPIGKKLISAFRHDEILTIIGVVKDYHIASLHDHVAPVSMELVPNNNQGYIGVKLNAGTDIRENLAFIEQSWNQNISNKPFQYFFFDEEYQNLYKSETSTGRILIVFSALSILIACMGLIGLITYTSAVRQKEIGIRKVLGAGIFSLVKLLGSHTMKLLVVASIVSWPCAYIATNYWLDNFTDRISVHPMTFLIATLSLIILVLFTISFQTLKTALSNPVDSLRDE